MKFSKHITVSFFVLLFLLAQIQFTAAQNLDKIGKKDMVKISGGLNVNSLLYTSDGINDRRKPFTWFLNGNINVSVLDWSFPMSYSYSNNQGTFTQPFNQVAINPSYKWIKSYIGYTSMTFSQYTLAGHVFSGVGVELSPKNWRIAAMYGKLKNAVPYDALNNSDANMSYNRMGYGFKAGYETNGKSINVIYFTARDDASSIPFIPSSSTITPEDNAVISIAGKSPINKYISVEAEYALSGLTRNTLINENNLSIENKLPFIFKINETSKFYSAYKAGLTGSFGIFKCGINYERVDPDYKTLGGYFFNNDLENITLAPAISLLGGKLNLSANTGFQRNNLNSSKGSETNRWIGNLNGSYAPNTKWNISAGYSNFSSYTNIRPVSDPYYVRSPADTLNFYQINQSGNGSISYNIGGNKLKQSITLSGNLQVSGQESGSTKSTPTTISSINAGYTANHTPTKASFTASFNINSSEALANNTLFWGPGITFSKSFLQNLMRLTIGSTYNQSITNNITSSSIFNHRIGCSYNPKVKNAKYGKPSFNATITHISRLATSTATTSFNELTANITLAYSF